MKDFLRGFAGMMLAWVIGYLVVGFQVAEEMAQEGTEYANFESYTFTVVQWPRMVTFNVLTGDRIIQQIDELTRAIEARQTRIVKGGRCA